MLPLLLAFLSLPEAPYKQSTAAVTELNHVYNEDGELRFDQLIFWEWRYCYDREAGESSWSHHVMCWRIVKQGDYQLRKEKGGWVILLWEKDGEYRILRRITTPIFRETSSNYDREVEERKKLPQEFRQGF